MATLARELQVITIASVLVTLIYIPAILAAREGVRDDLRRQDITSLKRALETYYNSREYYVTPPRGAEACTTSSPSSWFFGEQAALLQAQAIDVIPHDVREHSGFGYTYCATDRDQAGKAQGYYLQAELERPEQEIVSFDEDEQRKFHYRVLHEDGKVYYRVCGGTELQCQSPTL